MDIAGACKRLFVFFREKSKAKWSSLELAVFGCVGRPLRQKILLN